MKKAFKRLKGIKGHPTMVHLSEKYCSDSSKIDVYKVHVKTVSSTMFTASLRMREIQVVKTVQPPLTRKMKKVMLTKIESKNEFEALWKKNVVSLKKHIHIKRKQVGILVFFNIFEAKLCPDKVNTNCLVTYIKRKFNAFALMIESHSLLHVNSAEIF